MKTVIGLISFLFLFCQKINAADVVYYDTSTSFCLNYYESVNEFNYMSSNGTPLTGYMIFTDRSSMTITQLRTLLTSIPVSNLKKTGDPSVAEKSNRENMDSAAASDYKSRLSKRSDIENRINSDLVIVTLIEVISELNQVSVDEVKLKMKQVMATKLKLPSP